MLLHLRVECAEKIVNPSSDIRAISNWNFNHHFRDRQRRIQERLVEKMLHVHIGTRALKYLVNE